MLSALPAGDDLTVVITFFAAAMTVLIAAAQERDAGWRRWAFVSAAAFFFLCGIFFPTIKAVSPRLTAAIAALIHSSYFPWIAGVALGFTGAVWRNSILQRKTTVQVKKPPIDVDFDPKTRRVLTGLQALETILSNWRRVSQYID